MNIFFLSRHPGRAAKRLCNKHVIKMILESTQLLYTAHHFDPDVVWLGPLKVYKKAHQNHPMARWTRASWKNYRWLWKHAMAMTREYTRRYGKTHACVPHLERLREPPQNVRLHRRRDQYDFELAVVNPPQGCLGAPLCMGDLRDVCQVETPEGVDLVGSYENYYAWKRGTIDMSWEVNVVEEEDKK